MSLDWYRKNLVPRLPVSARQPTRFEVGPQGAYRPLGEQQPYSIQQQPPPYPTGQAPIGQLLAGDAFRLWRGTADGQKSNGYCPNCGSPNYFETIHAAAPAGDPNLGMDTGGGEQGKLSQGHCFDCGHRNGRGGPTLQSSGVRMGRIEGEVPTFQARSARPLDPDAGGTKVFAHLK